MTRWTGEKTDTFEKVRIYANSPLRDAQNRR
jgi:hypothetical protein